MPKVPITEFDVIYISYDDLINGKFEPLFKFNGEIRYYIK